MRILCAFLVAVMFGTTARGARLVNFGATLCGPNMHMQSGTCQPRTQGKCPTGYYQTNMATQCNGGGYLIGWGATLCGENERMVSGTCKPISETQGACPDNMHDVLMGANGVRIKTNGKCPSGYSVFPLDANCAQGDRWENMCAILCSDGLLFTGAGTCAATCASANVLRTSTGVSIPIYATKQTSPSIHIRTVANDVCYVNLELGAGENAINLKYNNNTYHTIK